MRITVVAEMLAKPGREEELKHALLELVEKTREEEGCVQYDLHVCQTEPARFLFYETWASAEALQNHAESAHLKAFGEKAADMRAEPPKVVRYTRIV